MLGNKNLVRCCIVCDIKDGVQFTSTGLVDNNNFRASSSLNLVKAINILNFGQESIFPICLGQTCDFPFLIMKYHIIAAIGGPTGELLEHNAHLLNQIYTNISNMQVFPIFYVKVSGSGIQLRQNKIMCIANLPVVLCWLRLNCKVNDKYVCWLRHKSQGHFTMFQRCLQVVNILSS